MNRTNRVMTVGALVTAVGAAVSLGLQPETIYPAQPGTSPPRTSQPSTLPDRDFQPGRTTPGLSQPGRDSSLTSGDSFQFQQGQKVSRDQVEKLINAWPQESKKAAQATLEKYGPPDGGTFQELIWHNAGPWEKVVVSNEAHDHNDPMPHKDVLMGKIKMKVPQDKVADLLAFDSSLVINRTAGTLAAVCDKEESNFAAINLAHDIIQGSKSVQEAKDQMAKVVMGLQQGTTDPITQDFKFEVEDGDTGDPGTPHRGGSGLTPGADRPGSTPEVDRPRGPGMPPDMIDPLPRTPGMDPTIPPTPGERPGTPPRDPLNPSPTTPPSEPKLPGKPGGG